MPITNNYTSHLSDLSPNPISTSEDDESSPKQEIAKMGESHKLINPTLGVIPSTEHYISLRDTITELSATHYHVAQSLMVPFKEELQSLLDTGIIKRSTSPITSSTFANRKKNGKLRILIDYRKLKARIMVDNHPFPWMEDILLKLRNAKIFSTLNLNPGYYQIRLAENSIPATSFVVPQGQFEFFGCPSDLQVPHIHFNE